MTIEEYLRSSLQAFELNDALLADIIATNGIDLSDSYTLDNQAEVGKALASTIEQLIFMPRMSNISENGFSQSWDYANLGKYYLWLCRRWGLKPNAETVAELGIPTITDRTGMW